MSIGYEQDEKDLISAVYSENSAPTAEEIYNLLGCEALEQ